MKIRVGMMTKVSRWRCSQRPTSWSCRFNSFLANPRLPSTQRSCTLWRDTSGASIHTCVGPHRGGLIYLSNWMWFMTMPIIIAERSCQPSQWRKSMGIESNLQNSSQKWPAQILAGQLFPSFILIIAIKSQSGWGLWFCRSQSKMSTTTLIILRVLAKHGQQKWSRNSSFLTIL